MMVSSKNLLFQGFIFRFHVKFQRCTTSIYLTLEQWCSFFSIHLESQGFLQEPCDPNLLGKHQETALHCNWAAGNLCSQNTKVGVTTLLWLKCDYLWGIPVWHLWSINSHTLQTPPSKKLQRNSPRSVPLQLLYRKRHITCQKKRRNKNKNAKKPRCCLSQQRDFVSFIDWSSVRVGYDSSGDSAFDHGGNICQKLVGRYLKNFWCNRM